MRNIIAVLLSSVVITACSSVPQQTQQDLELVDSRVGLIAANANKLNLEPVLSIDHSRLASEAEQDLSASRVELFSDDKLNTELLKQNIEVGLDLPFRVLSYSEDGEIKTRYTNAQFLQIRYGLNNTQALAQFEGNVEQLVSVVPDAMPASTQGLEKGYGITRIDSEMDFNSTIESIKSNVLAQDGTEWFLTLDYSKQAKAIGVTLPNATLLVFGAPGPGAKAMKDFMSIGLDTFGQKVLVYQQGDKVVVAYNDIVDMARLHYQDSALPHRVVNTMLGKTISKAVEK
ncbi:DUF302 domain-containing protein [Vibrio comitans]|uniref:DUF302 domain-containing protein n=1 Tax=Vibrio comitans NBRC 102076 TaxID=1219078 RepID=A0A4Y3IJB8_9VIBR|nr:DUF302 domain-containing protein [Vibrio comitans]GEA59102.1 hypothetical protein VCO01S_02950 [Vibrio comitans NBRC 102076]